MWILKLFVFSCVLIFIAEAREKHECELQHNVTDADWEEMKKDIVHLSDKLACFMKCVLEKDKIMDSEGNLNLDKFNVKIDKWAKLDEKGKSECNICLNATAPVKTCSDIKPIHMCVANSKIKHDCRIKNNIDGDPWIEFKKDVTNPQENILCFLKCSYEGDGIFDSEGIIIMNVINQKIDEYVKLSKEAKIEADKCLQNIPPVRLCTDIKLLNDCIYKK